MSKFIKYIVSAAAALSLSACSDEMPRNTEVNEDGLYIYKLDMDASLNDGSINSRSTRQWTSSDYVYVAFESGEQIKWGYATYSTYNEEWTLYMVSELPDDASSGKCSCWYLEGNTYGSLVSGTTQISLDATQTPYCCATTFTRIGDRVAISALMKPMLGRVRLRSTESQYYSYRIAGPHLATYLNMADNTLYVSPNKEASVYVNTSNEDGYYYSPYISAYYFADDTERPFKIRDNYGNVFVRNFTNQTDVLNAGTSGYLDLPTANSHEGWKKTEYKYWSSSYDFYGYTSDISDGDAYFFHTVTTMESEIGINVSMDYQVSQVYDGTEASKKTALLYIEVFDGDPDNSEPFSQTSVVLYQPNEGYELDKTYHIYKENLTLPSTIATTNTPQYRVSIITDGVRIYTTSTSISNF